MRRHWSKNRRAGQEVVIPLAREELKIGRRKVPAAKVVVDIGIEKHQQVVPVDLTSEHIEIRRIRVNRDCERMPPVRHEGDTTIIPLVEEVVEVCKRLIIREEIHLVKHRKRQAKPVRTALRSEKAVVKRVEAQTNSKVRRPSRRSRSSE